MYICSLSISRGNTIQFFGSNTKPCDGSANTKFVLNIIEFVLNIIAIIANIAIIVQY